MFDKSLVKEILRSPLAGGREWSLQGFGMLRLYLSPYVRLHVWSADDRVTEVSDIHNHPWHFTSKVLAGRLLNVRYKESGALDCDHYRGEIQCGTDAQLIGDPKAVKLKQVAIETLSEGGYYDQGADEIHQSKPLPGTVTIIKRMFTKDTEHALVYWPIGTAWVDAKPRQATDEEVLRITDHALNEWF